jgi:hypothetical protein
MSVMFRYVQHCRNGRHEVICKECNNSFWLTGPELFTWTVCPHCEGWWTWSPLQKARDATLQRG